MNFLDYCLFIEMIIDFNYHHKLIIMFHIKKICFSIQFLEVKAQY